MCYADLLFCKNAGKFALHILSFVHCLQYISTWKQSPDLFSKWCDVLEVKGIVIAFGYNFRHEVKPTCTYLF